MRGNYPYQVESSQLLINCFSTIKIRVLHQGLKIPRGPILNIVCWLGVGEEAKAQIIFNDENNFSTAISKAQQICQRKDRGER